MATGTGTDRPDDLKRILAEEIRAAIAEASPAPSSGSSDADSGTGRARGALKRSEEVLTPSVPENPPSRLMDCARASRPTPTTTSFVRNTDS